MKVDTTAKQVLFSTVRIETHDAEGVGHGTGFFYTCNVDGENIPFIVTNAHVIEDAASGVLVFTKAGPEGPALGSRVTEVLGDVESLWHIHPTEDLAIMPFGPLVNSLIERGDKIFYSTVSGKIVASETEIEAFDAIEEIVVVGYPDAMWDEANNLPIVRKGITATPLSVRHEDERAFLVDAPIFTGSSGSPVFVMNFGAYPDGHGNINYGTRIKFVGLISDTYSMDIEGKMVKKPIPTKKKRVPEIKHPIDLGHVIRVDAFIDFVENKARELNEHVRWRDRYGKLPSSY